MSHQHGLDEYDDAALLRELLLRFEQRAKVQEQEEYRLRLMDSAKELPSPQPSSGNGLAEHQAVHLMTPDGDIECGETIWDSPTQRRLGTPDPTNVTCPKCLQANSNKSLS